MSQREKGRAGVNTLVQKEKMKAERERMLNFEC